jgi:hypothetical protein
MKLKKLTPSQLKRLKIAGYVTLAIVSASAYAFPTESYDYEYYSDANYTEQVGERVLSCDGRSYKWGIETPYRIGTTNKCEFYGGPPFGPYN